MDHYEYTSRDGKTTFQIQIRELGTRITITTDHEEKPICDNKLGFKRLHTFSYNQHAYLLLTEENSPVIQFWEDGLSLNPQNPDLDGYCADTHKELAKPMSEKWKAAFLPLKKTIIPILLMSLILTLGHYILDCLSLDTTVNTLPKLCCYFLMMMVYLGILKIAFFFVDLYQTKRILKRLEEFLPSR